MRALVCKANFAADVKRIMSLAPGDEEAVSAGNARGSLDNIP